ncbi:MAG: adenylate/guanylate cyclase domain-containing protein [Aquamicrobium sp.]|uniref:adenylate/guanylate cyclase domain-containing protein n=1 Tax=Mesorhizobium sp. Pch-S TaxID=2082387 RepID=UPI001010815A|nr:adenylate/guanylate cyclase domain-containing protein [Mesorhizobium sp. Pch-S]MBR2690877.1 adenylate/guanylate cyclase domain-containing protein [Aquamicrobium sp.]QAZ43437.1 adenylate/guanylate cyclase domain-containing protein [Mesorhizobium sp. Pch-S]
MVDQQAIRQLSTICAIDAVGFSRLMNENQETAVRIFHERRNLISETVGEFGGRIFGAAGDSLMAEFGSPIEALRAVLEAQLRLDKLNATAAENLRMPFRIGVATGVVIQSEDGTFGDCVNISARLQEFSPPGGVAITGTTHEHVSGRFSVEFTDLGPMQLKNIALPVRILVTAPASGQTKSMAFAAVRSSIVQPGNTDARDNQPAIAVLPFQNSSPDRSTDYLADGIVDDIIHGLAATRSLPVIARDSSFQFRDQWLGTAAIGNLLGARYLVTGSVASFDKHIRLSASLTDSSNGRVVWSGRFERGLEELIQLQDDLGGEIVSTLEREVDRVEQVRTFQIPWERLQTWQLVRRGRWHMQRRTRADMDAALKLFQQAYDEDPNSGTVLSELAWWYLWRGWLNRGEPDDLARVAELSQRALLVDSQDARPYAFLGSIEVLRRRPLVAQDFLQQALHYNPSFVLAYQAMGSARLMASRPQEAITVLKRADRLSPFENYRFHTLGELAAAYTLLEDWPAVITTAERSLSFAQDYFYPRFLKIGALVRSGQVGEARAERVLFEARHPRFSRSWIDWIPFADGSINQRLLDNFDAAG